MQGGPIHSHHFTSAEGVPLGGVTYGLGFTVSWQHGATRTHPGDEPVKNGAFVEDVLLAAVDRLEHYQASPFACEENQVAISYVKNALAELHARTASREARGVEGTHVV